MLILRWVLLVLRRVTRLTCLQADGKLLIRMSHATCVVYAIIMAGFSTGLFYAGIGMGYIYLMMGCIISSAVLPATLTLMWKDQNWVAAALSPPLGLAVALIAWLVTAKRTCGALDVDCTGSKYVTPLSIRARD